MAMDVRLDQSAVLRMEASPTLMAFTEILVLTELELEQRIDRELDQNPALERSDSPVSDVSAQSWEALGDRRSTSLRLQDPAGPGDEVERIAAVRSNTARQLDDLRLVLAAAELPVAEYLVGSLDRHGYLDAPPQEIAAELHVDPERVERILRALRDVGPPGIAACDARECLLLQLDVAETNGYTHPLARTIIDHYLGELASGKLRALAGKLGTSEDEVRSARRFIRQRLSPFPRSDSDQEPWAPPAQVPRVHPDAIVRESIDRPGELEVELPGTWRSRLTIDSLYLGLAAGELSASTDARRHAHQFVRRADGFITLLEQRSETIRRVVEYAANRQAGFVRHGCRLLQPLTRVQVARALGIHESTVSRATAGKFAMLPSGRLVPVAHFFQASLGLQEALRDVIRGEGRPMSDRELSLRLRMLGYRVARRTVAKYRLRLGLPMQALRSGEPTSEARFA
jgi:RNA polymerase sigma-54 factor